jgi:hypothetical protein
VKLIALLRNPIDRAYSQYQHEVRLGCERLSFEDVLERERKLMVSDGWRSPQQDNIFDHIHHSYMSRSLYIEQLKRWVEQIP